MKKLILIILLVSCNKIVKNINTMNKDINEELVIAINNNKTDEAIELIEKGANINYIYNGKSIIDLAIIRESLEIIKALIEKKVEMNEVNIVKIYDLALEHSDYNIIDLIKDKYKLEEGLIDNNKYLLLLCYTSNAEEVKKFIEKNNIIPLKIKDKINRNCLILSASGNRIDIVKMLIEKYDFNINDKDNNGWTALMVVSEKGYIEIAEILIKTGTNFNDKEEEGLTALMLAAQNGHIDMVKLLLEHGAYINDTGDYGWTALMLASRYDRIDIVKLLIDKGSNINNKEIDGLTSIMIAAQNGHIDIAKLLLEHGANINEKDNNGWTAMMLALKKGHIDIVKLLVKKGINVNDK